MSKLDVIGVLILLSRYKLAAHNICLTRIQNHRTYSQIPFPTPEWDFQRSGNRGFDARKNLARFADVVWFAPRTCTVRFLQDDHYFFRSTNRCILCSSSISLLARPSLWKNGPHQHVPRHRVASVSRLCQSRGKCHDLCNCNDIPSYCETELTFKHCEMHSTEGSKASHPLPALWNIFSAGILYFHDSCQKASCRSTYSW